MLAYLFLLFSFVAPDNIEIYFHTTTTTYYHVNLHTDNDDVAIYLIEKPQRAHWLYQPTTDSRVFLEKKIEESIEWIKDIIKPHEPILIIIIDAPNRYAVKPIRLKGIRRIKLDDDIIYRGDIY